MATSGAVPMVPGSTAQRGSNADMHAGQLPLTATSGAVPIVPGSTATGTNERRVARTGSPRRSASARFIISTAAAQSVF